MRGERKAMARKESVTRKMIVDSAFELCGESGFREVTARKLAAKIGCSTQPIFRVFNGMEELSAQYIKKAVAYFEEYYDSYDKEYEEPFVDLGLAYISFAQSNANYFELLFMNQDKEMHKQIPSLYEILNGTKGNVTSQIRNAQASGVSDAQNLFMRMWIFIHGAAAMSITGDYDLDHDATARMLTSTYYAYTKA